MHLPRAAAALAVLALSGGCTAGPGPAPTAGGLDPGTAAEGVPAAEDDTDHATVTDHDAHVSGDRSPALSAVLGGGDVELPFHLVDGERFLVPGDELRIVADDGTQLTFVVDRIDPADDPAEVYAMGPGEPELRLLVRGRVGDRLVRATLA